MLTFSQDNFLVLSVFLKDFFSLQCRTNFVSVASIYSHSCGFTVLDRMQWTGGTFQERCLLECSCFSYHLFYYMYTTERTFEGLGYKRQSNQLTTCFWPVVADDPDVLVRFWDLESLERIIFSAAIFYFRCYLVQGNWKALLTFSFPDFEVARGH